MIRLVDVAKEAQVIQDEFFRLAKDIVATGRFVQGQWVERFEDEFKKICGLSRVIAVNSGTSANHLSIQALALDKNLKVVVPVNTFIATVWGVLYSDHGVAFCDVEEDSFNLDLVSLKKVLEEEKDVGVVVAVHLYGQPADLDELTALCKRRGLLLVEDCCQSHLAKYEDRPVGSFGATSAFSFYPGKNLGSFGEGGLVGCRDEDVYSRIRDMRNQGMEKKYIHKEVGHNYRMCELIALSLYLKLKYLSEWTERRRRVASWYRERLNDLSDLRLPKEKEGRRHVYHLFVIRVPSEVRDDLRDFLSKKGIEVGIHYPVPLHLQPALSFLGYRRGKFPVAERLAREVISLPMHPFLSESDVDQVCDALKEFFRG